jgi:hypothetical protein
MNIKKGYQLHITTWENDGDVYKTKVIDGLDKADVKFYIELASLFTSKNNRSSKGFGNGGITEYGDKYHNSCMEDVVEAISKAVSNNPNAKQEITSPYLSQDFDEVYEHLLEEVLDYTEQYEDVNYFCRVFSNFNVYYFPEEVKEVTEEFKS